MGASRFRALALIGAAATLCATFAPHVTRPSVASKRAETDHPDVWPPQWLPVVAGIIPVQSSGACHDVSGGRRYAMLVHLAITLSTVHGWVIPSDDKISSFSSHESAITGGIDGARRQLKASGCSGSWSVCPPAPRPLLHVTL